MKRYKSLILIFFLVSCGKVTTFKIDKVNIKLINGLKSDSTSYCLYNEINILPKNEKIGIILKFDVSYSESSGGIEPGLGGTKDSIVAINVFLETNKQQINISNALCSYRQNQYLDQTLLNINGSKCIWFDNVVDFIKIYNLLYYKKAENSQYNSFRIIKSGWFVDNYEFCFWIKGIETKQLNKADMLSIVIELSNGRKLRDKFKIK